MAPTIFPFLGELSKLPTEIRLLIWEYLFSTIHLPYKIEHEANPLSILGTSRFLYKEVASHLYHKSHYCVRLVSGYHEAPWGNVVFSSSTLGIGRDLENEADFKSHFRGFPHRNSVLRIIFQLPDLRDPGQIVLLWQKAHSLIDLLLSLRYPLDRIRKNSFENWKFGPPIIWLIPNNGVYEMEGWQRSLHWNRLDCDIINLALFRLLQPPLIKDPSQMTEDEWELFLNRHISPMFKDRTEATFRFPGILAVTKHNFVPFVQKLVIETATFLDFRLDEMPGRTARFIRLELYKHWYKDGTSWESPYEKTLLQYARSIHTGTAKKSYLRKVQLRHKVIIGIHNYLCGIYHQAPSAGTCNSLDTTWDSGMWSAHYKDGLPEIGRFVTQQETYGFPQEKLRPFTRTILQAQKLANCEDSLGWLISESREWVDALSKTAVGMAS